MGQPICHVAAWEFINLQGWFQTVLLVFRFRSLIGFSKVSLSHQSGLDFHIQYIRKAPLSLVSKSFPQLRSKTSIESSPSDPHSMSQLENSNSNAPFLQTATPFGELSRLQVSAAGRALPNRWDSDPIQRECATPFLVNHSRCGHNLWWFKVTISYLVRFLRYSNLTVLEWLNLINHDSWLNRLSTSCETGR